MRIIAGRFRRRTLRTNPGLVTRPITDRVKETLFERLGDRLVGAKVADVFAGTGTLGLEALSRGAVAATFIETDRKAVELLRENIAKLKVESETLVWPVDVMRTSFKPKGVPHLVPFDIVFFDPPYKLVPSIRDSSPLYRSLVRLAAPEVSSQKALLVLRVPEHAEFDLPQQWEVQSELEMSNMRILRCAKSSMDTGIGSAATD